MKNKEIEAFLIDSESFHEAVKLLELYKTSLEESYKHHLKEDEIDEELLDNMKSQIEVVTVVFNGFRASILKTIYGEDIDSLPEYH